MTMTSAIRARTRRAGPLAAVGAALLAVSVAACGSSSSTATTKSDAPIPVGAIATITGFGNYFSQASSGAQAYLDYINSTGGIGGRKFTYTLVDDKQTPSTAAQDAQQLAAAGDVAIVGDASQLNCEVNAKFYAQSGLIDIPALGFTPPCYSSTSISPVDIGLFSGLELDLVYAWQRMHLTRICALVPDQPGYAVAMASKIAAWEKISHLKLAYYNDTLPAAPNYTPYVVSMKRARCQAVVVALPGTVQPLFEALGDQGVPSMAVLTLATSYDAAAAQVAKAYPKTPFITYSQFVPYGAATSAAVMFRKIMTTYKVPVNATSEAGYIAAEAFVAGLKTIKGPITRASVTKAFEGLSPIQVPLLNPPYTFGSAAAHQSNTEGLFFQAKDGAWTQLSAGFVGI